MDRDVIIVGSGIAGCATALTLESAGLNTIILGRSPSNATRVGEHLPPNARPLLAQLGLWEAFSAAGHLPCPGTRASWGSTDTYEREYIFNSYGDGWSLDRRRFDVQLTDAAAHAGTTIHLDAAVLGLHARPDGWDVETVINSKPTTLHGNFLVDATGRASAIARKLGSQRIAYDKLVGVIGWMTDAGASDANDARLLVEAVPNGWWYAIPLPGSMMVAAFMTDAPLQHNHEDGMRDLWLRQMEETKYIRQRTTSYGLPKEVVVRPANTYCMNPGSGRNWLAVGDAAAALDPLSSMGISRALASALVAAKTIGRYFAGDCNAVADYAAEIIREFEDQLINRLHYYRLEQRWPDQPFWSRRHQVQ